MLTRLYVGTARTARRAAVATGALAWLDARRDRRSMLWLRSLFAIYDIDDMIRLDLPWWTFKAIERTDAFLRDRPNARVFEYGSGASTVWLGRRAGEVISVEHDAQWASLVAERVAAMTNIRHSLVPPDAVRASDPAYGSIKPGWRDASFHDYVHAIDAEAGCFDLIVVDGRCRVECFRQARQRLARGGIIVFDNSWRTAYRAALDAAHLPAERWRGLAPGLPYRDETTIVHANAIA